MTLAEFLSASTLTHSAFARHIGVSAETVRRYTTGERIPAQAIMGRIFDVTGGRVTPNDFYARSVVLPSTAEDCPGA